MTISDVSDYTMPCGASTSCRHQICQHCGEPMRIGNSRATDHPGTKTGTLQDQQCRQCRERGGPPEPTPEHCVDCNKPFRAHKETVKDRPGTVRHEGRGYCGTCYGRKYRAKNTTYHRDAKQLERAREYEDQREQSTAEIIRQAFDYSDIDHLKHVDMSVFNLTVRRRIRIAKRIARQRNDLQTMNMLAQQERMTIRVPETM